MATIKAPTKSEPKATVTTEYSEAAWAELELQRNLMKERRIGDLFNTMADQHKLIRDIERQITEALGNRKSAHRTLLLLAVKNAGEKGLLLADARRFIPEQKDLESARDYLMRTEDEDGNETAPLIGERQGKKNALRLFFIKPEDKKAEQPEGTGEPEGDDDSEK